MTDFLLRTRSTEGSGGLFYKAWRHSRDFLTICGNFIFARVLMHLTGNGRSAYLPPSGRFIWGNCRCHQRSVVFLFFFFFPGVGRRARASADMSNGMWVRCTAGVGCVFLGPVATEHMAYGKRIPLEKPAEQQEIKQTQMRAVKKGGRRRRGRKTL